MARDVSSTFKFPPKLTATKPKANFPSFKGLEMSDDVGNMYTLNIDGENIAVRYHAELFQFRWNRFQKSGNRQDLDSSVVHNFVLLELLPEDHPSRLILFNSLGESLFARYERWRREVDLEVAIEISRVALGCCPEDSFDRFRLLHRLGGYLSVRLRERGNQEDLEESITVTQAAWELAPIDHPLRADMESLLEGLANSLYSKYENFGEVAYLDRAIALYRTVLGLHPEGRSRRPTSLGNLALRLYGRFEKFGRHEDLDEAVALIRSALGLCHEGSHELGFLMSSLAAILDVRFRNYGKPEDLKETIALYKKALAIIPEGDRRRPAALINFANFLFRQFEQFEDPSDLEESIRLHRATLSLFPEDHLQRALLMNNIANSLRCRFSYGGRVEDLEESITLLRAALILFSDGNPFRSLLVHNLATCLKRRHEHVGRAEDLDEAMAMYRVALSLRPQGHNLRSETLNNLANALVEQYSLSEKSEDLDESIALHREALELRPEGHYLRYLSMVNLAATLSNRLEQPSTLDESITLLRDAVAFAPEEFTLRPVALINLSQSLTDRFHREKRLEDLEEAISIARISLTLLTEDRPVFSKALTTLASCLESRFKHCEQAANITESIQLLECATDHIFSGSLTRLSAATECAKVARAHNHPAALNAYKKAMVLLQRALTVSPTARMQHDLLASQNKYRTLALDAASYAIEKGDLCQAVELLEQGRAILWSQMRNFRTPLDRLEETSKSLADRLRYVSRRLEALTTFSETNNSHEGGLNKQMHHSVDEMLVSVRRLSEEQSEIISEIRQLQGFDDFLQATPFEKLQKAASEGPVIVINHSNYRCDAIIVIDGKDEPCICVPLDREFYVDSYKLLHDLFNRRARPEYGVHSTEYDGKLREVMAMLWDRAVFKVVHKLNEIGIPKGSRIWWCPTSVLSALPFHAAEPYDDQHGNKIYLLDDYISSYTPTLKSLISARQGTRRENPRLLVIGDTGLASTKKEMIAIQSHKPINKPLRDGKASRETVIKALQETEWVHFACHGHVDPEPFNTSFKLANGSLTLLDIARTRLPNAEFAFLSACHTAEQDPIVVHDEVLHLAAAMQFCGFRSVIGTMWELLDTDGPILARDIYTCLLDEFEDGEVGSKRSAVAVRSAAINLKARKESDVEGGEVDIKVERWVNLVHIGA